MYKISKVKRESDNCDENQFAIVTEALRNDQIEVVFAVDIPEHYCDLISKLSHLHKKPLITLSCEKEILLSNEEAIYFFRLSKFSLEIAIEQLVNTLLDFRWKYNVVLILEDKENIGTNHLRLLSAVQHMFFKNQLVIYNWAIISKRELEKDSTKSLRYFYKLFSNKVKCK